MVSARAFQHAAPAASRLRNVLLQLRQRVFSAWGACRQWTRLPLFRIRPRVSLLTGSVLVLLTLYLPTSADSCNHHHLGVKLASGAEGTIWLGRLLNFLGGGRAFYLLCLALAALTLLLLLASVLGSNLTQSRGLSACFLVTSGSVALLSTTDLFALAAFNQIWLGPVNVPFDVLLYLLPVACLRAEFWTRKGAVRWVLILVAIAWGGFFADAAITRFYPHWNSRLDSVIGYLAGFTFSLLPLGLWLRYPYLRGKPDPGWRGVSGRLAVFYAVVLACDIRLVTYEKLWGLVVFFLGAYLLFYGHWQLRQEAGTRPFAISVTHAAGAG